MASHFKEPEEKPRHGRDAAAGAHTPVSTPAHRGGDESYHAPVGNPHAAANAGRASQGFVPVTSANADAGSSRHGRRTDPYDLSGRRENNPKRRRNRIISGVLFALGVILILVAAGMWGYNQWQYHEQDQINEKLAAYATIDPKGSERPWLTGRPSRRSTRMWSAGSRFPTRWSTSPSTRRGQRRVPPHQRGGQLLAGRPDLP